MEKTRITDDEAIVMLKGMISNLTQFGDALYGLAHKLYMEAVKAIEDNFEIVGYDGTLYDSETDEECWFDQDREEGIEFIMQKIQDFGREEE